MIGQTFLSSESTDAAAPAAIAPRGRRRPWVIAAGVMMASIGALTVMWLVGVAGQRQEVVVVRTTVPYGQSVGPEDLGVARVSLDPGIPSIAAEQRSALVGQVAATQLLPGMLLVPGMLEESGDPRSGSVLVPVALPSERMPAGGVRAGDRILAVTMLADQDGVGMAPGAPSRTVPATVVRVGAADVNGVAVVDVTVAVADGPGLAVAAADGQVALVVQPAGG